MKNEKTVASRFYGDVEKHVMRVIMDNGVYRHLTFKRPGDSVYHFSLVTWPGHLAITGDMGTYVFSRLQDMFQFFHGRVNPSYWIEKCVSRDGDGITDWDEEAYLGWLDDLVRDVLEFRQGDDRSLAEFGHAIAEARRNSGEEGEAIESVRALFNEGWIDDLPESQFTQPSYHILWCLHAIKWGIEKYQRERSTE